MSSAGERLVQLSGLAGGSASAHLLAITQGAGTGATVFASRMTVWHEREQMTLVQRPENSVEVVEVIARTNVNHAVTKPAISKSTPEQTSVLVGTPQCVARTKASELWIVSSNPAGSTVLDAPKSVVTHRRRKTVAVI